ncbi:glycosyltransferase family 61 protein [Ketogulonicigenium robustum]|nr:glycosyltransferase family 61 protein [Ketogulonicigenium robustum]
MPAFHDGISYIGRDPNWIIRPAQSSTFRMFAASDNEELRGRQDRMLNQVTRALPKGAMEVNALPVVLDNARFAGGLVQIDNRFWLNGASGGRVRSKFERENAKPEWRLQRYLGAFRRARATGAALINNVSSAEADALDIAIELKNGFNYYHFTTETLGSLAHFVDDGTDAPISLQLPSGDVKSFQQRFIEAIYPSLAHRVNFVARPKAYNRIRSVYSHQHFLYQVTDERVDRALAAPDVDSRWEDVIFGPSDAKLVAMMSYDSSLRKLRKEALKQIRKGQKRAYPRLIWLGRDEEGADARARGIEGHEPLLEALTERGFEAFAFENLTPLEQIEAMNGADIVIAPHGAGLANMIYAKTNALVIEIGTRQTQLHRWGDFLKCAHVSGCRYDTVFADIAGLEDLSVVPGMFEGHRGIRVSEIATWKILEIVDEELSRMKAEKRKARKEGEKSAPRNTKQTADEDD